MTIRVLCGVVVTWLVGWSAVLAGTIPVVVDHYLPDPRPGAPVKFGVPFPENTFKVGDSVQVVDDKGAVVPSQSLVTATWDPKGDRGVRWLLMDMLADKDRTYKIVYGKELVAASETPTPIAKLGADKIELSTGALSGAIALNKADLFGGLVNQTGAPLVQPDGDQRFSAFYVEHETKGMFRSDLDPSPTIVLEETGPVRACVKIDGWYANAAGEKFCRYSIRAHFFHGRADVKLEHTFIFTGRSKDDRIRSLGLQMPLKTGQRGYIPGTGTTLEPTIWGDFTSTAKVVQDSPNHDVVELLYYGPGSDTGVRAAGRSTGNMNYAGVSMAIRDAWQQYPWGYEINDGVTQVQFWPRGDRLLDTTFDGYWWFLDEHQKHHLLAGKPKAPADLDAWLAKFRTIVNATGVAKTHELWLSFASNVGFFGQKLVRETAYPVIACADPAWSTSTRALDFCAHTPRNDQLFADEEKYLDAVLPMVRDLTEKNHWYGWWDWGAYYQRPGATPGAFKDTHGQFPWHRNHPKSHYGWGTLPWMQYFRTGDRNWLRYAQTYTLYSADRSFVHHTANGRFTGEEYHYDHSEIHWVGGYQGQPGGAQVASNIQGKEDYVYMYWLTGDRRALDCLKEWGEQVQDKPKYFQQWKVGLEVGNDVRNSGQQMHRLMMLYQATWDPRYLELAKFIANSIAGIQTEAQLAAVEGGSGIDAFHTAAGWAWEGLWYYYNLTKDERIKTALLAYIERSKNYDSGIYNGYGPIRAYTFGYELTHDPLYLDMIRAIMDDYVTMWMTPNAWAPDPAKFTTISMGRALGTLASAPQEWKDKHLPTNVRGCTLRFHYSPFRGGSYATNAVCFNETKDAPWRFRLLFTFGGKWVLTSPTGKTAYESPLLEAPFEKKWLEVEVPADGQTGTYTLRCVEPSKFWAENKNPDWPAEARVLRSDLPLVLTIGTDSATMAPPRGRSLYFQAQPKCTAWLTRFNSTRELDLRVDGKPIATSLGLVPDATGAIALRIPETYAGKLVQLHYSTSPTQYLPLDPAPYIHPGILSNLWLDNAPPVVAANPEDYFVPKMAP